jgi:ElaB/YqjD/DUF883 family membrane-anchored ribosome-binding protein
MSHGYGGGASETEATQETSTKGKNMSHSTRNVQDGMDKLAEDAQAVLAATAELAHDGAGEARQRLSDALDAAREICGIAQKKAAQSVKAADTAVRQNPYQAIGIAIGVGALIGFLCGRRNRG